jgi:hypothetical protein
MHYRPGLVAIIVYALGVFAFFAVVAQQNKYTVLGTAAIILLFTLGDIRIGQPELKKPKPARRK